MKSRNKSTLFLIEQIIVIAVFAICAAVCISLLTTSYFYAKNSNAAAHALIAAENAAEIFKVCGGDFEATADELSGVLEIGGAQSSHIIKVPYDKDWRICDITDAEYLLIITDNNQYEIDTTNKKREVFLYPGHISVNNSSGEILVDISVVARQNVNLPSGAATERVMQ